MIGFYKWLNQKFRILLMFATFLLILSCNKTEQNEEYVLTEHTTYAEKPSFVNMVFHVADIEKNGIDNLTLDDFNIYENGNIVPSESSFMMLRKIDNMEYTLKTAVVIDNGASMGANLEEVKNAVKAIVERMIPQQELSLYVFSDFITLLQDFTSNKDSLINKINSITLGSDKTNLIAGFSVCNREIGANFGDYMLLLTDGRDDREEGIVKIVLGWFCDTRIFTVGIGNDCDKQVLEQLGTAGVFFVDDFTGLKNVFARIQDENVKNLNSLYMLSYMSSQRGYYDHLLNVSIKGNANDRTNGEIETKFNSRGFYTVQPQVALKYEEDSIEVSSNWNSHTETAVTYMPNELPEYTWQSDDESIISVRVFENYSAKATFKVNGNIGQSTRITVTDIANSLSKTVVVTIVD